MYWLTHLKGTEVTHANKAREMEREHNEMWGENFIIILILILHV